MCVCVCVCEFQTQYVYDGVFSAVDVNVMTTKPQQTHFSTSNGLIHNRSPTHAIIHSQFSRLGIQRINFCMDLLFLMSVCVVF